MSQATICIVFTIFLYLVAMLAIGLYYAKRTASTSDFFLGGRTLGPFVTAMSAEASDMSSYLVMGLPGLAYLSGVADVGWTIIGLALGTYFSWLLVARRIRRYSQITGSITLPQFFSDRFHDKKSILSAIAALIIIVFFVPYTAAGFAGCGKLFSSLFGMNYITAMVISAVVIVGYTATGGFLAASITDFVQSIIMTTAIVAVLIFSVVCAGGIESVFENARRLPGFLSFHNSYLEQTKSSEPYTLLHIITTVSWGLGYLGMPHFLLRFMAIGNDRKLKISRRVASTWAALSMVIVVVLGIAGRALSDIGAIDTLHGSDTETIIVRIAGLMSEYGIFPALLAGIVLSGILASTMSTADSQLLAASSSVSQNLLQETFHLKLSPKADMLTARATVIAIAVLGIILARDPNSSIFGIVSFAWAGFGAGFGPVVVCALFWKRATLLGAIAGMTSGGVMVFVWKYLIKPLGGIWGIYELLPAFIVGIVMIVVVSLMTKAPSAQIEEEFELAKGNKRLL